FARAGRRAVLWSRSAAQAETMRRDGRNRRYLPDTEFPAGFEVTADLAEAVEGARDILIAIPSHALRSTLEALRELRLPLPRLAWATKGFELDTGLLPHQVVAEVLSAEIPTAVLSGPTFATEVGAGLPSAITIASGRADYARELAEARSTDNLRAYTSTDVTGVEVGGATNNVYAIGAGICDGLGFGANTRIALVTRGL